MSRRWRLFVGGLVVSLLLATMALAADAPRYDVPSGFTRCSEAMAWNGFFKWASVRHTNCRRAARFMRGYARVAQAGPMPRRVSGYRCRVRFWENDDGDVYASRHRCRRGRVLVRFYGMV